MRLCNLIGRGWPTPRRWPTPECEKARHGHHQRRHHHLPCDTDGNQVLRTDPGQATLFLGEEQIAENTTASALSGTRYYTIGRTTIAQRTSTGDVQYLIPDRQGTATLAVDYQTLATARRQHLPFGSTRGTAPTTWSGDKGYIGGTPDPTTTFENLGAREYDPANGRFLSADPVTETTDPTQLSGYDYAGNDPVSASDPRGFDDWYNDPSMNKCVIDCGSGHHAHHGKSSGSSSKSDIITNWTSSTGCASKGYDGRVCSAINGVLTGGGSIQGGAAKLDDKWHEMQKILKDHKVCAVCRRRGHGMGISKELGTTSPRPPPSPL